MNAKPTGSNDLAGQNFLVTGGAGFFGDCFIEIVLSRGARVTSVDIVGSERTHPALVYRRVDIRDTEALDRVAAGDGPFDAVFHFAALLAHGPITDAEMRTVNIDGTRNVRDMCRKHRIARLIFTSSNCLWGEPVGHPVAEGEPPNPVEEYGRAKLAAEVVLKEDSEVVVGIIRTPTIIQAGRLGLLAILFEFIDEGRKVWVVGNGGNRYQFIAAADLAEACLLARSIERTEEFNVGSDDVPTLAETYQWVINQAGTRARVARFPAWIAIPAMRTAHAFGLSPLGPYHWKMIAESFSFDTAKAQTQLGWRPTRGNREILAEAYDYYKKHRLEIANRTSASAHRRATPLGAIKILKWLS